MKPFRERNYYELLEVPVRASADQIRSAYQRALERSAAGAESVEAGHLEELRDLLGQAFVVLTDPAQRLVYDQSIEVKPVEPPSADAPADRQLAMDELLESASSSRLRSSEWISYLPRRYRPGEAARSATLRPPANGQAVHHAQSFAELDRAPQLAEESAIANAEAALVHASARGEQLRNRPVDIAPDTIFNGDVLRRIRLGRGLSVQQMAERTRIPLKHLENIEADRYNHLPANVYLRGILTSLSRELGLDPARVSRDYIRLLGESKAKRSGRG